MGGNWRSYQLEEILESVVDNRGKTPPTSPMATPYELIEVNALVASCKYPDFSAVKKYVDQDTYETWFRKGHPKPDDILFSTVGSIAEVSYVNDNRGCIAQNIIALRPDTTIVSGEFLYYLLKNGSTQSALVSLNISSVQPSIKVPHLLAFKVQLPPLFEQKAIAAVLSALDDKIELNRRMNETLEAMAKALFKSWFVDFDPVRAKAASRPPEGLAPEIAALFPDAFEDSELGEIPKEWRVGKLNDIASLNPETWSKQTYPSQIEYVDLSNTKWGVIEQTQHFHSTEAPSRAQRILRPGDSIVGTVRPGNGSYALIGRDGLTGSTGFAVLRPNQPIYREVVYLVATSPSRIEKLAHLADGGAYPAIRPDVVAATEFILAPELCIAEFSKLMTPLFDKIEIQKISNKTLSDLRDSLLPKLMSGEIRVQQAESLVKELV